MNQLEYKIRSADPSEYQEIGNLLVHVYSSLPGFPKENEEPDYYTILRNVGEFKTKPQTEILIAVAEDYRILGSVVFFGNMHYYGSGGTATKEKDAAGFRLLAVHTSARGLGIGKQLTLACIDLARRNNNRQLIIHTTTVMQTAWRMYVKLGFKRSEDLDYMQGEIPGYGFRLQLFQVERLPSHLRTADETSGLQ
ncbi:MAG TPA: GNAT family N-acetyltransferase [Flavisolibacter sp.]|jgi:GNAT superfamily N-acetyltransferase|nr:GNAT family N-acetyltransferase [Flavisolibacter sp.]